MSDQNKTDDVQSLKTRIAEMSARLVAAYDVASARVPITDEQHAAFLKAAPPRIKLPSVMDEWAELQEIQRAVSARAPGKP